jgi:chemotaxis protein MotA
MKAVTAIGIGIAVVGILGGAMMEGTSPAAFINIPATMVVLMGTFGATMAGSSIEQMKAVPELYKKAFSAEVPSMGEQVDQMVRYAEHARRDGLLALESELSGIDDDFTRKGLQLVVDGTDPALVREILEAEMDGMAARHAVSSGVFEKAGGFAPTMGILGTVMGLVHVLGNLANPESLGPAISGAFIATLMGVGAANVVFLPVAGRLRLLSEQEIEVRTLVLEGILSVQAGDNPRVVAERLKSFVPPAERDVERAEPDLKVAEDPAEEAAA